MKQSDSIAKISPDLVVALAEIEGAAKSAVNPHFRSKYANLEAVVDGSRDILAKHHCAVMQGAGHVVDGKLHVTTRVLHKSGEWIEEEFSIPLAKSDPQATLAALTYARRGALMSMLGMPAVEDDGETAMGRGTHTAPKAETAKVDPPKPTLSDRADRFEATLKGVKSPEDLRKAYDLGAGLCAELDMKDPERLAEINGLYERRFADLSEKVAA